MTRFHGDLDILASGPQPVGFIAYHRSISSHFSWGGRLFYGKVRADDRHSPSWQWRNLNFSSPVAGVDIEVTFNFKRFILDPRSASGTLFLAGGLSGVFYAPVTERDGTVYAIGGWRLEEEGDVRSYPTVGLPFGVGYKQMIGRRWFVQTSVRAYPLLSDYPDGVKGHFLPDLSSRDSLTRILSNPSSYSDQQVEGLLRGNPQNRDWFFTWTLSLHYIRPRDECAGF